MQLGASSRPGSARAFFGKSSSIGEAKVPFKVNMSPANIIVQSLSLLSYVVAIVLAQL
jgi:hypothetical protein